MACGSAMDDALLDAHLALRHEAYRRHALFVPSPQATAALRGFLEPIHTEGTVHALEVGGEVRAVFAWRHDPSPFQGVPLSTVAIDHALDQAEVEPWLEQVIDRELPRMEADVDLLLDVSYQRALRALLRRGVGIDSLQLLGEPNDALSGLLEERHVEPALPDGLRLVALDEPHVDAVIELYRATFAADPRYCWFGANPRYLESLREALHEDLDRRVRGQHVIVRGRAAGRAMSGEVIGHAGAAVKDRELWGPSAGMSLVLKPELRGRGLLRSIYRALLESMIANGARAFRGGTSQPPVIRLARTMRRPLQGFLLRRPTLSPRAVFDPYLGPAL